MLSAARQQIGIDLGTANVLVFVKRKGITLREPSVVAIDNQTQKILAVGDQAQEMVGRTPANMSAVRPLKDGVIADFEITEAMLKHFIGKACGRNTFFKPMVIVCVPANVTSVQRRAVVEAALSAGAKQAYLIEEPMAAAIGAGLAVEEPRGNMVVDIGGGTTDIAVISLGGIVVSESIRVAGTKLDDAITRCVRKNYNLLIGERTAETIKIGIGSAYPLEDRLTMEVRGRDLVNGLPKAITINSDEVREALEEPVSAIVEAVKGVLEKTPPELASDIIERGIMLTGGGALLRGLNILLSKVTGIPVLVADDPISCVAMGTGKIEAMKLKQT